MIINETVISPYALILLLISGISILLVPKKYAIIPFLIIGIFIPFQQRIVIISLDFTMLKIIILFGFLRILFRQDFRTFKLNIIDITIVAFVAARVLMFTLQWQSFSSLISILGGAMDILGIYFVTRLLIGTIKDLEIAFITLAGICIILSIFVLIESTTYRNYFSIFGGVPEYAIIRFDKLRCQGPFGHSISLGVFAATLVPIFINCIFLYSNYFRTIYMVSIISCAFIVFNTGSSTPVATFMPALIMSFMWFMRKHLRQIQIIGLVTYIVFDLITKSPFYHKIMALGSYISGSNLYHRYTLIDKFIANFGEWWLVGVRSTEHWGIMMEDTANQFVQVGINGGILPLILFISLLFISFREIGKCLKLFTNNKQLMHLFWGLGTALLAHIVTFFGLSYWDQILVGLYSLIALIASTTQQNLVYIQIIKRFKSQFRILNKQAQTA